MFTTIKKLFEPMMDDMTSTKYHIIQMERRRDEFVGIDSSVKRALPGFSVDVNDNGPVTLNLHIW